MVHTHVQANIHTRKIKINLLVGQWWHTPLIPALRSGSRWISEFEASLVYRANATQKNRVLGKKNQKTKNKRNAR